METKRAMLKEEIMGDQMRRVWRAFSEIGEADYKGYRTVTWLGGRVFGYDAAYDPCFFGVFFLRARRGWCGVLAGRGCSTFVTSTPVPAATPCSINTRLGIWSTKA